MRSFRHVIVVYQRVVYATAMAYGVEAAQDSLVPLQLPINLKSWQS
jgi:hypothetical protein